MPASVETAWLAAGGLTGTFGVPTCDPLVLDTVRSVQEFTFVAHVFGGAQDFTLSREIWEASIAGGSLIGLPLGSPQGVGAAGASFVQHERGVVLLVPEASPQPLPQAVFDVWSGLEAAGTSLGPPTAFGFPNGTGNTFPFQNGRITLSNSGVAAASGPVGGDRQRYFQPGDPTQQLTPRQAATFATPIISGALAFARMRADIASTSGGNDFVYILSWHCNVDVELVPGETLRSLLAGRAAAGVQIRAMLWAGDPVPAPPTVVRVVALKFQSLAARQGLRQDEDVAIW